MITLPRDTLLAYLYNVGALETARHREEEREKAVDDALSKNQSALNRLQEPIRPSRVGIAGNALGNLLAPILVLVIFSAIGFAISLVLWLLYKICLAMFFPPETNVVVENILFYMGPVIGVIVWAVLIFSDIVGGNFALPKTMSGYRQELQNYQREKQKLETERANLKREQAEVFSQSGPRKKKMEEELQRQYSLNVLAPKYRNMEAVLFLYNRLAEGWFDTLKEALNDYEDFVWKRKNAEQKAQISKRIEDIVRSQEDLFYDLKSLYEQNETVAKMAKEGFHQLNASAAEIQAQNEVIEGYTRTTALL